MVTVPQHGNCIVGVYSTHVQTGSSDPYLKIVTSCVTATLHRELHAVSDSSVFRSHHDSGKTVGLVDYPKLTEGVRELSEGAPVCFGSKINNHRLLLVIPCNGQ